MALSQRRRWYLLFTVSAGLLLITLDNSVLFTALPTLTSALGASTSDALWIINAYPLVMTGLLLGAGTLGDRIGHRRMFLAGLVIFGVASLFAAFSPSVGTLIAARACLAIGAAAMMPSTLALIGLTFDDERERNLAIAIWGSLALVGSALGPIIGGALLARFWWGSVFLINVPVVVVAFVGTLAFAPPSERDITRPWDLFSSLLALVTVSGFVAALKALADLASSWDTGLAMLALSAVGATWFVKRQAGLAYPLLDFSIFRNRAFLSGTLAASFSLFAIAGLQLLVAQRYQLASDFSPLDAGMLVSAVAFGALPSAILGGALLHRVGLRLLISGGLGVGALGAAIVAAAGGQALIGTVVGLAIAGLGLGASISVASSAIIDNVPSHRAGMASSVEEVSYEFGSLFAVALLGSLSAALYAAMMKTSQGVPGPVQEGFVRTLAVARQSGADELAARAATACEQSYVIVLAIVALALFAGSALTGALLRDYGPGSATSQANAH